MQNRSMRLNLMSKWYLCHLPYANRENQRKYAGHSNFFDFVEWNDSIDWNRFRNHLVIAIRCEHFNRQLLCCQSADSVTIDERTSIQFEINESNGFELWTTNGFTSGEERSMTFNVKIVIFSWPILYFLLLIFVVPKNRPENGINGFVFPT